MNSGDTLKAESINNNVKDTKEISEEDLRKLFKYINDKGYHIDVIQVSPSKLNLFGREVLIGLSRSLGFTLIGGIVLTLIYKLLSYLITINIPFFTTLFKHIVSIIKNT